MRLLNFSKTFFAGICLFGFYTVSYSQSGQVSIAQDEIIPELLELKADLTRDAKIGDRYQIQVYYGDNNSASEIITEFRSKYSTMPSRIIYETPNYKVWVGNFRNRLEADRALLKVKEEFPSAFIPKPHRG